MTDASKTPKVNKNRSRWLDSSANRGRSLALIVGCFVTVVWTFRLPPFTWFWEAADVIVQDTFLRAEKTSQAVRGRADAGKNIVILTIDDESMRVLGTNPPLPRQIYARLCQSLAEAQASVVAFQVVFDGDSPAFRTGQAPSEQLNRYFKQVFGESLKESAAADDQAFANALENRENIVLGSQIHMVGANSGARHLQLLTPRDEFVRALGGGACLGNVSLQADPDGVVRRATICGDKFPGHRSVNTSFALRVLEKQLHASSVENPDGEFVAGRFVPRNFKIDYAGPAGTFESIPLWKALEWTHFHSKAAHPQSESLVQNPFVDKIVIIGYQDLVEPEANAEAGGITGKLVNAVVTPFGGSARKMSDAEVQANIISNLLNGKFLTDISRWQEVLLLLLLTALFAFGAGLSRGRTPALLSLTVGLSSAWFVVCAFAYFQLSLLVPCMVAILGIFCTSCIVVWVDENVVRSAQRKRKTRLFRKLASRQVADEIEKHQLLELCLEGKEAQITVLVCEISNLTDLLEGKQPEPAIKIANDCIGMISAAVTTNGGVIERYLNHGVVAIWGAPLSQLENERAKSATAAALTISQEMAKLHFGQDRYETPQCLIGICSGTAVCGMVGAADTALYTAMGRPVDEAFQLTAENRIFGTRYLVSNSVLRALGDTTLEMRELSHVAFSDGVEHRRVFELLGEKGRLPGALEEATTLYRRAMRALEEHDRQEAERLLESALRLLPDDGPSQAALAKCRRSQEQFNVPH